MDSFVFQLIINITLLSAPPPPPKKKVQLYALKRDIETFIACKMMSSGIWNHERNKGQNPARGGRACGFPAVKETRVIYDSKKKKSSSARVSFHAP